MAESSRAVREDFVFSHGKGHQDIDPEETTTSFAVFVTLVENPKRLRHGKLGLKDYLAAPRKVQMAEKNGPYFITGTFSHPGRQAKHLTHSYAFVADLDSGEFTQRKIEEVMDGYSFVAWTTYSHSKVKAKWRIVIPYDRALRGVDKHGAVFEHFQGLFNGAIDEASRKVAQLYYFPGCPRDALDIHEVVSDTGCPFFNPFSVEASAPEEPVRDALGKVAGRIDVTADMVSALQYVPIPKQDGSGRYHLWLKIGMALHHETRGSEAGLRIWREWHVAQGYDRDENECDEKWPTFGKHGAHGANLTRATLFDIAIKNGWRKERDLESIVEELPVEFSEDSLAAEFGSEHGAHLRYVHAWGKWFEWKDERWKEEQTLHALDLVRQLCRTKALDVRTRDDLTASKRDRIAMLLSQAHTVAATMSLARADRRIAMRTDEWDRNRFALHTPSGTADLHTGQLRAADPEDYITKMTACVPGGRCPTWDKFLTRVMDGNTEVILFLQRYIGYCLTGDVSEHALVFFYGTGGNGKSTFLNTITALMGDYASVAPSDTFIEGRENRHPTELAMLRGSRLVVAQEVEEGKRWAESRIKTLTGGEPITARFMRQDFFTFDPQFKLIIAGNHKPGLRNVDEAIRRRMHLVPWTVTIPPEERDTDLIEKLRDEWPGILAWAIEGCLAWQRHGLAPPREIVAATSEYLQSEDQMAQWMDECCELGHGLREPRSFVYASYKRWCEEAGEHVVVSAKRFYDRLQTMGIAEIKSDGVRYVIGLKTRFATVQHFKPGPTGVVPKQ